MSRYTKGRYKAAKAWDYDDEEPFRPSLTVDDHEAADTGLVWPTGEPIMRLPSPMGFGRDEEWN